MMENLVWLTRSQMPVSVDIYPFVTGSQKKAASLVAFPEQYHQHRNVHPHGGIIN